LEEENLRCSCQLNLHKIKKGPRGQRNSKGEILPHGRSTAQGLSSVSVKGQKGVRKDSTKKRRERATIRPREKKMEWGSHEEEDGRQGKRS